MSDYRAVPSPSLSVSDLEVFSVNADVGPYVEHHATWTVGYAPEREAGLRARVIIATLHVGGTSGYGTIHVGALLRGEENTEIENADWVKLLAASDALETLYDFARVSLRAVLAIVDSDATVARKSPTPVFELLERAGTAETSEPEDEA